MNKFNHVAIITVAVLHQMIGLFWYSDFLFGAAWLTAIGKNKSDIDPSNPQPYVVSMMAVILLGYFLSWILRETHTHTAIKGSAVGALLGLVISAAIAMHYLFLQLTWTAILIDGGTAVLGSAFAGAVLSVWRRL